jgi:hypothetical protein
MPPGDGRGRARFKVREQRGEGAGGGRLGPADQDVVPAGAAEAGQGEAGGLAQAALGAVAGHGVADLARAGEAHADRLPASGSRARGRGPGG